MRPGEMGGWEMMPWTGMFFGPVMMILFIAVIVTVIVLLVRWLGGPPHNHGGDSGQRPRANRPDALEILRERFARGEIDEEEYRKRKRLLEE